MSLESGPLPINSVPGNGDISYKSSERLKRKFGNITPEQFEIAQTALDQIAAVHGSEQAFSLFVDAVKAKRKVLRFHYENSPTPKANNTAFLEAIKAETKDSISGDEHVARAKQLVLMRGFIQIGVAPETAAQVVNSFLLAE